MIDGMFFEDSKEFCEWFRNLNPEEPLDITEAMSVFFNLHEHENFGVVS